jgi:hypothetical protein
MPSERKRIVVVDVPKTCTAEKAEEMLNAACEQGYYVFAIHPGEGGGSRAFFNLRTRLEPGEVPKPRRDVDGREADAIAIIKANPARSITQLLGLFKQAGIKRGHNWVSIKRREILNSGGILD